MSDDNEKRIDPMDSFLDTDFGPVPVAPAGNNFVPNGAVFEPEPIPLASEDNFICLRGPCKFYLEQKPYFPAGNSRGSLDHQPIITSRKCMVIPGYEIDMTDEVVADCNFWTPLLDEELVQIQTRRDQYNARKEQSNGTR